MQDRADTEREQLLCEVTAERQRAQELSRAIESERNILHGVFESTPAQLAYLDPQLNIVWVNNAYADGSGHAREELVGRNHFESFPNPENQAIFEQVRDKGDPFTVHARPFEYANQPQRGVTYWDWMPVPVKDATGQVDGLVLSLQGVTAQVRAEKTSEEHLTELHMARDELELRVQKRTAELTKANEALRESEEIFRHAFEDEASELVVTSLLNQIAPQHRHEIAERVRQPERGEDVPASYEILGQKKDGSLFPFQIHTARIGLPHGQATVGFFIDVSEHKRAEEKIGRYVYRMETLQKIDRAILSAQVPVEIAAAVLHHVRDLLERCSGANLVLFDLEYQRATVLAVDAGRQTEFGPGTHFPLELAGELQDLRQSEVYLMDDIQTIPQPSPALRTMISGGCSLCDSTSRFLNTSGENPQC